MLPFREDWHSRIRDSWIIDNVDDIERIYTRVWQEVCLTLGAQYASHMDIVHFARYLSSRVRSVPRPATAEGTRPCDCTRRRYTR